MGLLHIVCRANLEQSDQILLCQTEGNLKLLKTKYAPTSPVPNMEQIYMLDEKSRGTGVIQEFETYLVKPTNFMNKI